MVVVVVAAVASHGSRYHRLVALLFLSPLPLTPLSLRPAPSTHPRQVAAVSVLVLLVVLVLVVVVVLSLREWGVPSLVSSVGLRLAELATV